MFRKRWYSVGALDAKSSLTSLKNEPTGYVRLDRLLTQVHEGTPTEVSPSGVASVVAFPGK